MNETADNTHRPESVEVTRDLLLRHDRPGPRYTSYPTVPAWSAQFGPPEYRACLELAASRSGEPLSLYVHIPFCRKRCAFCGCNSIATQEPGVAGTYLDHVELELQMLSELLAWSRPLKQIHWGGGTPTYLDMAQLERLFQAIADRFDIPEDAEISIEADPRVTTVDQVTLLRKLGFNRISLGVQDLDERVQAEIGRHQTEAQTRALVTLCREAGFEGINLDLIYGLPGQTPGQWATTISRIIEMQPDRLAVYSCAYLPDKMLNQRRLDSAKMPTGPEKYALFATARQMFTAAGYRAIGMDHFALPHDELTRAMDERRLHRNFMGYTAVPSSDMVACGISAIGEVGGGYAQNEKELAPYYEALDAGRFATALGCRLTPDDEIRRWTIRELMCNFHVSFTQLQTRYGVEFEDYFIGELKDLREFEREGFVTWESTGLTVLPLGQIFVRNIAMAFDTSLKGKGAPPERFSRTV
ncbi:MAG TPA: oxygen-independent coproporphyrinogen III oxidase [Candidatus Hydrogenedentes bacterium]|jgi:oxygen-independent coproporphyrinogen-3 oxidase|nr:oxygen-independent coproporphyrinogen III oxidase [Candidatus Hydrogenedentota bacterium]